MGNIGAAYGNEGEYEKALEMFTAALVINEKVLGNDHPNTKNSRDNIDRATRKINNNKS